MNTYTFHLFCGVLLLLLASGACEYSDSNNKEQTTQTQPIFYGTRDPQVIQMSDGEILAVGWLHQRGYPYSNFCSGTIIAPQVVITASHCFTNDSSARNIGFGIGDFPHTPRATFNVSEVHIHPEVDAAMLILAENATQRVPELVPININRTAPHNLVGNQLEGSGFGRTHDGSDGRYFALVYLDYVFDSLLTINGRGEHGMCFGDSGGPLLGPGPVVLGVESNGDSSCVGQDNMTRLDVIAGWIDEATGEIVDTCDGLDYLGRCNGTIAEWCNEGTISQHDCSSDGLTCGYVNDQIGYYCTEETQADPCDGLDYLGRCNGDIAEWCENGEVRQRDCASQGMTCGYTNDQTGYYCTESEQTDACGGLDYQGRCNGTIAEWCENEQIRTFDCSLRGQVCHWINDTVGNTCGDSEVEPDCVEGETECSGTDLLRCEENQWRYESCSTQNMICEVHISGTASCQPITQPDAEPNQDIREDTQSETSSGDDTFSAPDNNPDQGQETTLPPDSTSSEEETGKRTKGIGGCNQGPQTPVNLLFFFLLGFFLTIRAAYIR